MRSPYFALHEQDAVFKCLLSFVKMYFLNVSYLCFQKIFNDVQSVKIFAAVYSCVFNLTLRTLVPVVLQWLDQTCVENIEDGECKQGEGYYSLKCEYLRDNVSALFIYVFIAFFFSSHHKFKVRK